MATKLNEGLFYHPAGTSPEDVLRRLADGSFNPRLDNPFLPKLAEMARQMQAVTERRLNLECVSACKIDPHGGVIGGQF